jgi:hypothetical protein
VTTTVYDRNGNAIREDYDEDYELDPANKGARRWELPKGGTSVDYGPPEDEVRAQLDPKAVKEDKTRKAGKAPTRRMTVRRRDGTKYSYEVALILEEWRERQEALQAPPPEPKPSTAPTRYMGDPEPWEDDAQPEPEPSWADVDVDIEDTDDSHLVSLPTGVDGQDGRPMWDVWPSCPQCGEPSRTKRGGRCDRHRKQAERAAA